MAVRNSMWLALMSSHILVSALSSLYVDTTVGRIHGKVNASFPKVAQYLGVSFAEPPVGQLRFAPPVKKRREYTTIEATEIGPLCPQYILNKSNSPSVYTYDARWLQPYGSISEDCLSLDVYTPFDPKQAARNSKRGLPILVWIFGGGFYEGGTRTLAMDPSHWVQRTQGLIVVPINARTNVFGFPNARGIEKRDLNPGLLDQRMAIEWVRDNAGAFGGDASRITIWGQSSGAASVDFYNFAYPDDPIVAGLIQHSGSVFATGKYSDTQMLNFTFIANHFGCNDLAPKRELDCMREIPYEKIVKFMLRHNLAHPDNQLTFKPAIEGRTRFENYTRREQLGRFSKLPAIIGTNANEEASLLTWDPKHINMTYFQYETNYTHLCPASYASHQRVKAGAPTFRFFNTGNFNNTSPRWWEGAYHSSELVLLFGTYQDYGGPTTPFQHEVSNAWQDYYLAFISDPQHGLQRMGWPEYKPNGKVMEFAADKTAARLIDATFVEAPCATISESYS